MSEIAHSINYIVNHQLPIARMRIALHVRLTEGTPTPDLRRRLPIRQNSHAIIALIDNSVSSHVDILHLLLSFSGLVIHCGFIHGVIDRCSPFPSDKAAYFTSMLHADHSFQHQSLSTLAHLLVFHLVPLLFTLLITWFISARDDAGCSAHNIMIPALVRITRSLVM